MKLKIIDLSIEIINIIVIRDTLYFFHKEFPNYWGSHRNHKIQILIEIIKS